MKLLLVGCGNVARELAAILAAPRRFPGPASLGARIVGICTRTHGTLANAAGIDPATVHAPGAPLPWSSQHPDRSDLDSASAVDELDYDVLVELSTLSIEGRGEPALGYVRQAIQRRRHVVTANKGPLAFGGRSLRRQAAEAEVRLLFESTVLDGTPVFSLAREGLRGCRVLQVEGILNATSNLVLEHLASGSDVEAAVAEAQSQGFAEADPSQDLQGWDSAAKLSVLANVLMEGDVTPADVERVGIGGLGPDDFARAGHEGSVWRLLCRARRAGSGIQASVRPQLLSADHPMSACAGSDCMLTITTDLMTPFTIRQYGAGLRDTAYGVLNDLLVVAG